MDSRPPSPLLTGFKGINNRVDATRLEAVYAMAAENVLCDTAQNYVRRPGFVSYGSDIVDLYAAPNGNLFTVSSVGILREWTPEGTSTQRATGFIGAPFQWTTLGYAVFCQSAVSQWAIYPDKVMVWGSLCPAPSSTVPEETEPLLALAAPVAVPTFAPPPLGNIIGTRRNQLVVGVWEPEKDRTVLYFSAPDSPHCFDLTDFQLISGQVVVADTVAGVFIVGTDRAIYVDPLQVTDYGITPGTVTRWNNTLWFMTPQGFCSAPPFKNWTEDTFWPTCRRESAGAVLVHRGSEYFIALTRGYALPPTAWLPDSIDQHFSQGVS